MTKGATRSSKGTTPRAKTVGVYARAGLWAALDRLAHQRDQKPSVLYRELLLAGVRDLDGRLDRESSCTVFGELAALLERFDGTRKVQRMVRVEVGFYNRAVFLAKEFGKSMSEIAAVSMAYGLSKAPALPPFCVTPGPALL